MVGLASVTAASQDYQPVLNGILAHLSETAEYHRLDRLYPADPRVFNTNPLSLAYGAAGVAYAIHKLTQTLPQEVAAWLLKHAVTVAEYPPGLYTGMSGIAWCFLEIGLTGPAEKILQTAFNHPLLEDSFDLFYGMAGFGMAALRFFLATGNAHYLQKAIQAGARLLGTARTSEQGYCWGPPGECPLGLAHGSSGIGLFLLYLYLATREEHYLEVGIKALEFDLAAAISTRDGGLSWGQSKAAAATVYPYWRFGSAGIGTALLRFQRVINSARYASMLDRIFIDVDRKYAVLPGRFSGLAGIGEFLLDLHEFTAEARYRESAGRLAQGIMHFAIERNGGLAFPGELMSRLCCDYGTGSAGIALFLHRLMGRQGNDFMLDALFQQRQPLSAGIPRAKSAAL
jgi:lantibiotic modifying enzyme